MIRVTHVRDYKCQWGTLVDRGANGTVAGREVRLIEWASDQAPVDITGLDSHTIKRLQIGSFGGVTDTNDGPIIVILNQAAHMPEGRTIISSSQMEFFKCQVHEKSPHVTGKIPYVKTLEGYQIPLSIINGLPYMKLRPYTDAEWEKLPKIYLTSDDPWDPSVLDSKVPEEWYKSQPRDTTYLRDNPFDIHGEYRTGNPDEENEVPDPPGELEADMAHRTPSRPVSRRSIKAYLHNLVKDELDHEFEVYYADGDMYEHIDYDKRIRQIREVQQPRRSKRLMGKDKAQTAKQDSGTQKRRSKKSRKRGNYPVTKPGAVDVDDEYQSVEDIEDPRNVKDEVPSDDEIEPVVRLDSNNPAWMENPNEDKSLRPVRNGPKFVEPSKIN